MTIGLNQAWKIFGKPDCTLTIHAHEKEVVPQVLQNAYENCGAIITKGKGPLRHWSRNMLESDRRAFIFEGNKEPGDFSYCEKKVPNHLYLGRGIQATAITLAAHLGFKRVVLIGCDMCDLDGDHHGIQDHHVRTHGLTPEQIYREYYECTARVREIVYCNFGTRVYSLSPFLGFGREQEDYKLLRDQLGLDPIGSQPDTSAYNRPMDKFL